MSSPSSNEISSDVSAEISGGRLLAARAIWLLHVLVVAFLLAGWALPWRLAWWVYAMGAPFIQLGWIIFNDYCWLAIIEAKLRRETLVVTGSNGQEEQRTFVSELIETLTGRTITRRCSNVISYTVLWGGFAAACYRLHDS